MFGNDKIILASSSPRRKSLLLKIGLIPKKILNPNVDETLFRTLPVTKRVLEIAIKKGLNVKEKNKIKNNYILSFDNIVYRAGKIFEKTSDKNIVKRYLCELSGKKHYVYGGISLICPSGKIYKKLVTTEVFFKKLSFSEINNDELIVDGIGKAGGYAIQNLGEIIIKKIKGSYSNAVGLSIYDLNNLLTGIGWNKSI